MSEVVDKLQLLLRRRCKSPETRRIYLIEIRNFLEAMDPDGKKLKGASLTEWDLHRYLEKLEQTHSDSYVNNTVSALKHLWRAMGKPFPLEARDFGARGGERRVPIMAPKQVERLIVATKKRGTKEQKAYLALSTTYGMRVGELARVGEDDLDVEKGRILIHTEKGGRERWHKVPGRIVPYIFGYSFSSHSEASLNLLFRRICSLAQVKRQKRQVWHSLRRSLVTALRARGVDVSIIANFMRYKNTAGVTRFGKQASYERIVDHYTNYEDEKVDQEVFRRHPFLSMWGKNGKQRGD